MKKIFYILLVAVMALFVVACERKDYSFSLELTSVGEVRTSVNFKYKVNDPKNELKDSKLTASIYGRNSETVISSQTLSYDKEDYTGSITFSNLDSFTEYTVKFFAGYKGEKILLKTKDVKTKEEGIETNPYHIKTVPDFKETVSNDPDGYFELDNDIDFAGETMDPLFTSSSPFTGRFNGNGHTISNFKVGSETSPKSVRSTYKYFGFFGNIGVDGEVFNLTLSNFELNVTRSAALYVGILAGSNSGNVTDIHVVNSKILAKNTDSKAGEGEFFVGGLTALNTAGGEVKDCSVDVDINTYSKLDAHVGGVCASNDDSNVSNVNSLDGVDYVGSISVEVENTLTSDIEEPINIYVGGVIARSQQVVKNCSATGSISVKSSFVNPSSENYKISVGGLVGWNYSDAAVLENSTATMSFEITSYDAKEIYLGLIAGENGSVKSPSHAAIFGCEYTLPTEGSCVVNTTESAAVKVGVVAVDRKTDDDNTYTTASVVTAELNCFVEVEVKDPEDETIVTIEYQKDEAKSKTIQIA